ncbi:GIY-YIG nuclease family protein [Magnetococcales bacterium HHB-1]
MVSYVLWIHLKARQRITVGAKGICSFEAGDYLYVGSAKRAWQKRIARHLTQNKHLRWHIDYILAAESASVKEVWVSERDQECATAEYLMREGGAKVVIPRLGASDCRCASHFLHQPDHCAARLSSLQYQRLTEEY